jgi:hypothetical protein
MEAMTVASVVDRYRSNIGFHGSFIAKGNEIYCGAEQIFLRHGEQKLTVVKTTMAFLDVIKVILFQCYRNAILLQGLISIHLPYTLSILFLLSPLTFWFMFDRSSYSKYLFKYVIL